MKTIKYLMIGALMIGIYAPINAQEDHKAIIEQVTNIIKTQGTGTEKQVKDIFKANKKNVDVITAIGRAYLDIKDTTNAQIYADLAIARDKHYGDAYVLAGDIEAFKDNGGAASGWYEQATYFDPKNPNGYRRYAYVNSKVSPSSSVAKLEELRKHRPDYPVDIISAEIYDKAGNISKALEYYNKVDRNQMEDYQLVSFALNYFLKGEFDKSLEVAQFGITKFPANAALNRICFYNLTNQKKYEEALKYADALFNKSEKTKITESDYLYYGHAYLGMKDYDKAIEMFNKALENNSDNKQDRSDALKNLANAYTAKGDYTNAAQKYEEYLKTLDKLTASEYAGLGGIYLTQAQEAEGEEQTQAYQKAAAFYKDLAEKFPNVKDYATLWQARINSYMDPEMKTYQAKPFYEELVNMLKDKADRDEIENKYLLEAYQYLGFYYYKTDDKANYTDYWNRVLALDPNNATAKQVLGK